MSLDFSTSYHHIAKKQHICNLCGEAIKIGEKYLRYSGKYDDYFFDEKYCADCENCLDYYCCITGEYEYTDDDVLDTLRDRFCDGCVHGFKTDDCIDDCEESLWHCAIIQKALKGREQK